MSKSDNFNKIQLITQRRRNFNYPPPQYKSNIYMPPMENILYDNIRNTPGGSVMTPGGNTLIANYAMESPVRPLNLEQGTRMT